MKLLIDSSHWFFRYGTRHCSVGAQNWQGSSKQRIIRYFIEPVCSTIERDEYETRG